MQDEKERKSTGVRYIELFQSLQIIRDCLDLIIKKGKSYQIVPISGQLRGILISSNKPLEPLFFEVHKMLREDTSVYIESPIDFDTKVNGATFFYEIPVPSLCKTEEKNYKIRLQDWLNLKIIRAESDYSIAELIKLIADKKGGAHYDEAMKKKDADLTRFRIANHKIVDEAIILISNIILQKGHRLLKKGFDFHYYVRLELNYGELEVEKNIIRHQDDRSWIAFSITLRPNGSLWLNLIGPYAITASCLIMENVPKEKRIIINLSYELKDDMTSEVCIYSSDGTYNKTVLANPVFVPNIFHRFKYLIISDDDISVKYSSSMTFEYLTTIEDITAKSNEITRQEAIFKGKNTGVRNEDGGFSFNKP